MLTVLSANGPSGYRIANSLRFRSSASAYLSRTPASAGNRTTWTWSGWAKLGSSSSGNMYLLSANTASGFNDAFGLSFASWSLNVGATSGGATTMNVQTTQVFRDFSSWYHIVVAVDTTQATAADRVKIYANGTQVTALSATTYPAQNASLQVNSNVPHYVGALGYTTSVNYDGYMAEVNFIDGQALTPSSFGAFNTTTGVWSPKSYTGTYGTNGFKLNFSNGTSTTTLGYDSSGNGNNWTTNNISLTAGSTYDWMIDSPTPYAGSSYGVGNYAVLSPITPSVTTTYAPTSGNLNVTLTAQGQAISTIAATSGKWYAELVMSSGTVETDTGFGFQPPTTYSATFCGSASSLGYVYLSDGRKGYNGVFTTYGNTWTLNDVIGVALDLDNGKVYWSKNGTWQASGDPVAGTNAAYTGVSGTFAFVIRNGNSATNNKAFSINFGQRPFNYTPPTGYKALNTQNLPAPSIQNGASYMAATTYTGNGSTQSIANAVNGVSFQPDFVWVKSRSLVAGHELVDSVRGAAKTLYSNLTNAEDTTSQTVTAFNSNGFSVGADTGANSNGATQIAWQWKAGGTAVTNTAGSITSSVSANPTAGFSVVTYTGNGAVSTVGHGLGVAPNMVIYKKRNNTASWGVYHSSLGAGGVVFLDLTLAFTASTGYFNNTVPNTTVLTVGAGTSFCNDSGATYVAYCFAAIPGYSAFGSYTGNGSTDGPFVYCGFRPRFVLIKRTDSAGYDWPMRDAARSPYNEIKNTLLANSSNAEATNNLQTDFLSNGFKLRDTGGNGNASGGTYIYAAFCEVPMNFALAR